HGRIPSRGAGSRRVEPPGLNRLRTGTLPSNWYWCRCQRRFAQDADTPGYLAHGQSYGVAGRCPFLFRLPAPETVLTVLPSAGTALFENRAGQAEGPCLRLPEFTGTGSFRMRRKEQRRLAPACGARVQLPKEDHVPAPIESIGPPRTDRSLSIAKYR